MWIDFCHCTWPTFSCISRWDKGNKKSRRQWKSSLEEGEGAVVEGEGAGGARGGCAGLLESLPSLVAANGPAPGSAIHSYQFASCCIFFSLVFHSLTHAILLFKLLKKRQRPFFPEIHCRGLREWGGKERKKKKKNTFSTGRRWQTPLASRRHS